MVARYSITLATSESMSRVRNFVFTVNNYQEHDMDALSSSPYVKYLVYGREVAPGTGTPHLQGYCELVSQLRFSTLKTMLPTAHIESRLGTAQQAADYCKKDGDFVEQGSISAPGKRNDIHAATSQLQQGYTMREVAIEHPEVYVKYSRGLEKFQALLIEPRDEPPTVTVLVGATGTGKSRMARELTDNPYIWQPQCKEWFDGYTGQKDAIFEEFRGQLEFGFILTLLDRYDCKVQFKGGMTEFCATNIVITSPKHPKDWYTSIGQDKIDQLLRRITEIKCLL